MHDYPKHKENFDFEQRHVSTVESLNNSNKNFFSDNYIVDIFMFTSSIISLISTILVIYLFCKLKHMRTLVPSLILHKIKEVEANPTLTLKKLLCKTSGSIHLFKIKGALKSGDIKLNKNYLWDTLEIDWNGVTMTFNDDNIELPKIVAIKIQDKIKVRRLMNRQPLNFHVMIRQGSTWFNLETEIPEVVQIKICILEWPVCYNQSAISCTATLDVSSR